MCCCEEALELTKVGWAVSTRVWNSGRVFPRVRGEGCHLMGTDLCSLVIRLRMTREGTLWYERED